MQHQLVPYKIYPPLFNEMVKPFRPDPTYFRGDEGTSKHKSRDGLTQRQLSKAHDFSVSKATRLSFTLNRWLDIVRDTEYLTDTVKKRLVTCTYRFGTRRTYGFICRMRDICPWCRAMQKVDILRASYKIPETAGLIARSGAASDKRSIFRSPADTLLAIRSIVLVGDEFTAYAVFLRSSGKWKSQKTFKELVENLMSFNADLIESPRLEEYMSLMKQVKVFTRGT